jgi:hypothetical protein
MRDHNDVGLNSDDGPSPTDVGVDDPSTEEGILDVRCIDSAEHGDFKLVRFRIVEFLQVSDCLLFLILKICKRLGHSIELDPQI